MEPLQSSLRIFSEHKNLFSTECLISCNHEFMSNDLSGFFVLDLFSVETFFTFQRKVGIGSIQVMASIFPEHNYSSNIHVCHAVLLWVYTRWITTSSLCPAVSFPLQVPTLWSSLPHGAVIAKPWHPHGSSWAALLSMKTMSRLPRCVRLRTHTHTHTRKLWHLTQSLGSASCPLCTSAPIDMSRMFR